MSVEAPPASSSDQDLHLLLDWREPGAQSRPVWAAGGSILVHIGLVGIAVWIASLPPPAPPPSLGGADVHTAMMLVLPRDMVPAKPPDKTLPRLTLEDLLARRPRRPGTAASSRPAVPPPSPPPAPPVIASPKIKVAEAPPPALGNLPIPTPVPAPPKPPPKPQPKAAAPEPPKLAFEIPGAEVDVPHGNGTVPVPKVGVDQALESLARPGGAGNFGPAGSGRRTGEGGYGALPKMLSDPLGVDFRPYLARIVVTLRQNWMAIAPESARRGSRGTVVVQFVITKEGTLASVEIVTSSGIESFDRAALTALRASNPFPPLPAEFRGTEVRLQAALSYNLPTQ
jgi:TonB family protein